MRRVLICMFPVLAIAVTAGLAFAGDEDTKKEKAPDRVLKPFLWVIPGEVPSYLFGTAHSTDPRITKMHPLSRKAFDESAAAYFEVDLIKDMPAQMAAMKLPAGKKTEDVIPADLLKRLDARLTKIHPMITRAQIGDLKPFAWVILVPTLYEQMKKPGMPMLDAMLYGEARRAGKTVGGLEDPVEQTTFLDTVTDAEALTMLRITLDQWDAFDKEGEDPSEELIGHYLRGDAKGLHDYAMEMMAGDEVPKDLAERLMKGLAYDRNERIAKAIAKHVQENPKKRHFFAVGAMHLLGKQCVQEYLQKLDIETRRVEEKAKSAEGKPAEKKKPAGVGAGGR